MLTYYLNLELLKIGSVL